MRDNKLHRNNLVENKRVDNSFPVEIQEKNQNLVVYKILDSKLRHNNLEPVRLALDFIFVNY
jgi:hypothetical protein